MLRSPDASSGVFASCAAVDACAPFSRGGVAAKAFCLADIGRVENRAVGDVALVPKVRLRKVQNMHRFRLRRERRAFAGRTSMPVIAKNVRKGRRVCEFGISRSFV